jgi:hypothetical protein
LQVRDYYGVNYPDDKFENQVIEFVKRHEDWTKQQKAFIYRSMKN